MTGIMFSSWFIALVLIVGAIGSAFFFYAAHKVSYSAADDQEDMQEQAEYYARGGK
jgi:hypothetical protein